jgi:hypothetical protein
MNLFLAYVDVTHNNGHSITYHLAAICSTIMSTRKAVNRS